MLMKFSKMDVLELTPARRRIKERTLWPVDLPFPPLGLIGIQRLKLCDPYIALLTSHVVMVFDWRCDEGRFMELVSSCFLWIFAASV